MAVWDFK